MLSKETQYRIYAGTSKEDHTGWFRTDTEDTDNHSEFWSLDLGNGYYLDSVLKVVKGLFRERKVRINSIRRDRTIEDPDGDYKDVDFSMLFNVKIMVSPDTIKFDAGNNSFILISREPVDWDEFSEGVPTFEDDSPEQNWASFYS